MMTNQVVLETIRQLALNRCKLGAAVRIARTVHHGIVRFGPALAEGEFKEIVRCALNDCQTF